MKNYFALGIIVGIVLAAIGFSGLFRVLDKGVDLVKVQATKLAN